MVAQAAVDVGVQPVQPLLTTGQALGPQLKAQRGVNMAASAQR